MHRMIAENIVRCEPGSHSFRRQHLTNRVVTVLHGDFGRFLEKGFDSFLFGRYIAHILILVSHELSSPSYQFLSQGLVSASASLYSIFYCCYALFTALCT